MSIFLMTGEDRKLRKRKFSFLDQETLVGKRIQVFGEAKRELPRVREGRVVSALQEPGSFVVRWDYTETLNLWSPME